MSSNSPNIRALELYDPLSRSEENQKMQDIKTSPNDLSILKARYYVEGGIFWKNNYSIQSQNKLGFLNYFQTAFEEQLSKEHYVVVRVALFLYFNDIPELQYFSSSENQNACQSQTRYFDFSRDSNVAIENLLNYLKTSLEFNELQMNNFNRILHENPFNFRIMEVFTEGVPKSYKKKVFKLIYKAFLLKDQLQNCFQLQNDQILTYINENLDKLDLVPWGNKTQGQFRELVGTILYSVIAFALGKGQNIFYKDTIVRKQYQYMVTNKLLNVGRPHPKAEQKPKKKKVVLNKRSSMKIQKTQNNLVKQRKSSQL